MTKTLTAAVLALSLSLAPAHAVDVTPTSNNDTGILIGALVIAVIGIWLGTRGGGTMSTSNAPATSEGGGAVLMEF